MTLVIRRGNDSQTYGIQVHPDGFEASSDEEAVPKTFDAYCFCLDHSLAMQPCGQSYVGRLSNPVSLDTEERSGASSVDDARSCIASCT